MRTIWKMSSAEPAANYPSEPSTSARGGLRPVEAAGAEPDFMVDDEDDGFDWDFAQPTEREADPMTAETAAGDDPDQSPTSPQQPGETGAIGAGKPAPPAKAALTGSAAPGQAEQPEPDEQPAPAGSAAPADQPELTERLVLLERSRTNGTAPGWRWPAAMALLVAAVVAVLFIVREQMDAPRPAAAPEFAAQESAAGFPASPEFELEPSPPAPPVQAAPPDAPAVLSAAPHSAPREGPAAAPTAPRTASARPMAAAPAMPRSTTPRQKALRAAAPKKRERSARRAEAQRTPAAAADAISCILPGGQEVQASYSSCRARGGVIYR